MTDAANAPRLYRIVSEPRIGGIEVIAHIPATPDDILAQPCVVAALDALRTALATAEGERDEARRVGATEGRLNGLREAADIAQAKGNAWHRHAPGGHATQAADDIRDAINDRIERGEHVPGVKS